MFNKMDVEHLSNEILQKLNEATGKFIPAKSANRYAKKNMNYFVLGKEEIRLRNLTKMSCWNTFWMQEVTSLLKDAPDDHYPLANDMLGIAGGCRQEEFVINEVDGIHFWKFLENMLDYDLIIFQEKMFVGYRTGKCISQRVGLYTIVGMPKKIAQYLKLDNPEKYTGHCFRISCTPPELKSIVSSALSDLIPKKSKRQYEKCYSEFKDWCDKQNVKTISENILLAYLIQQSKVVKSSTLWSIYSMLKCLLNIREGIDVRKFLKLVPFLERRQEKSKISIISYKLSQFDAPAPPAQLFRSSGYGIYLGDVQSERKEKILYP
ncbi:hypothetical protein NQ317_005325 [Molorchus minor]|uniref:Uncharacterized protein n=1 Tax=Molorchus minor TaxID=1323400 RepID=A0ABQ9JXZ7_9CUCU|nr:hypothetical protein NQ317_005325 [Molorchus minor]